ncbi:uncharacterized protein LOC101845356 [Aplysia californica]|uniref:Uncharacterized protein LOC101845356 n=1 Tax=Aplysia californica TaxID=6500 RepID=A0ABM1W0U5_APLCA|nr:uncharacterized protein LOC101845356 [Aplysia californica]
MGRRRKHLDIQGGSKIYDDVSVTLSSQKPGKENPAFEMDTVDRLQAAALSRTEPYSSGFSQSLNGSRVNKAFIPDDISSSSSNQVSRRVEGGRIATISGPGLDEANLPPVTFDHELDHVSTQGSEEKVGLKRTMTLLNCSAILISVTGHVAIFVSPANVAKNAGSVGACLVVFLVVALNCAYVKYVQRVQTLLSASKIIALGIVIGAGIYQLASGDTDAINRMNNMFEGTSSDPGEVALALFYTVFSYGGWQIVTSLLEEVKNPGRSV